MDRALFISTCREFLTINLIGSNFVSSDHKRQSLIMVMYL